MKTLLTALVLALLLSGCSLLRPSTPPAGEPLSWQAQQEKNQKLSDWEISGKIGVRSPKESGSGSLFWQQRENWFDIRLAGPLGRGAARLVGNPQNAKLEAANQNASGNAQNLLAERLGWNLPLEALRWWLRGLPAPGQTEQLKLDTDNRLALLKQGGWQVDYLSYREQQGYWLPERLKLSGAQLSVTLVVKDWSITSIQASQ